MALRQYDYDKHADLYEVFELGGKGETKVMNQFLNRLFRRQKVSTVLDLTCGTGAQAIGLAKYGYTVTGSDISKEMLSRARKKAQGLGIRFHHGDMTKIQLGEFDAVISIYNAIAHLEPHRLEEAFGNVHANLNTGGTFVFDVINLTYMKLEGFRAFEYLDHAETRCQTMLVRFNDNTLDLRKGVMHINQRTYIQEGLSKPSILRDSWDMQLYDYQTLDHMLREKGFHRIQFHGGPNRPFDPMKSKSILVIAERK
jgi:SAM-dependent methyltransferase